MSARWAGFHMGADTAWHSVHAGNPEHFSYNFENFSHPFVEALTSRLNRTSVEGMLDPQFLQGLEDRYFFASHYHPISHPTIEVHGHALAVDVSPDGAYSSYNWELLYHLPIAIAVHLSKGQRFAEAQKWFHYVFDPTSVDASPSPQRWWKFLAFRNSDLTNIEALIELLSHPDDELSPREIKRKEWVHNSYAAILSKPFDPHAVARARPLAYQYYVVMQYLSNLIAWGDSLFLQYTIETINEASMHYVLASNILGPRPEKVPAHKGSTPKTFAQLKHAQREAMGSTLVELETQIPFNSTLPPARKGKKDDKNGALFGLGESLYFCVPRNDKLLRYWDTVADRLFKIRNCMDITGVVRPLALWDPPIDPGMLIKARAAGLDIASIVGGLNQPIGPLRSLHLIQKALELTAELKSLGGATLSAWEKGEAEEMALLRQRHEMKLQQKAQEVRFLQWKQAREATESLLRTRATTLERYKYYLRVLGQAPDSSTVPEKITVKRQKLTEENFDDVYSTYVGDYDKSIGLQSYPVVRWADGNAPSTQAGANGSGQLYLTDNEHAELNTHLKTARDTGLAASIVHSVAGALVMMPDLRTHLHFWGLGAAMKIFGGDQLSVATQVAADVLQMAAAHERDQAGMVGKTASYERRADEWRLQANLAAHELMQMGRQIISSLIAEQVAEHEYNNAKTQVENSEEIEKKLRSKFTNVELYGWMQGELNRIYHEFYRFAFETARKAERTMKRELMRPELDTTDFIGPNYWDSGYKGLLSGEKLFLDLKRMEAAYHDNNKRELELTRHVSLRQLDPRALLALRVTGVCTVTIPEWLYDLGCPGHYMRRIKSVALSIPSVVGPFTGVHCTLSLQRSTIRVSSVGDYARDVDNSDDRFVDYYGSTDSIVTSSGADDSGMFETNLHDERFLPFEGAGAISTWRLALPSKVRAFDYMTISDVVMHIRYTARDGGEPLAKGATGKLLEMVSDAETSKLSLLFSLRHDFSTEWSTFVNGKSDLTAPIRKALFPYLAQTGPVAIDGLILYAPGKDGLLQRSVAVPDNLADGVNGAAGVGQLSLPADTKVLKRAVDAQVFLVLLYHLGG